MVAAHLFDIHVAVTDNEQRRLIEKRGITDKII
jgi:hypothetical protein